MDQAISLKVLSKGNCWRTVHICKVKADTIRDQIQSIRTKYLFGGRYKGSALSRSAGHRRIKKIANKAELHHVTAHVYRHCFATFSLAAGAPLTAVRDAMNHKSISTTSLYLHSTEKDVSTYIWGFQCLHRWRREIHTIHKYTSYPRIYINLQTISTDI